MARRKSNGFSGLLTCLIIATIIGSIITYWYIIIPAILILVGFDIFGKIKRKNNINCKKSSF